jgi:hypothetical protein
MYGPPEYFDDRYSAQGNSQGEPVSLFGQRSWAGRNDDSERKRETPWFERRFYTPSQDEAEKPVKLEKQIPEESNPPEKRTMPQRFPPKYFTKGNLVQLEFVSLPSETYFPSLDYSSYLKDVFSLGFAKDVAHRHPTVYKNLGNALFQNVSLLSNYEELKTVFSSTEVKISILEDYCSKPPFTSETSTLKHFLENIFSNENYSSIHYLQQVDMEQHLSELWKASGTASFAPHALCDLISENACHSPTFYIGNKGVKTSLHYDFAGYPGRPNFQENDPGKHNLFYQISGSRRFVLFPDHFTVDLQPMTGSPWPHISTSTVFLHGVYEHCPIDDESKQMEYITQSSYPSLADAWPHRMEIVLKAGEALLIPARWWHMTEILEAGSAVNWWFHVDPAIESKINERLMKISSRDPSSETAPLKTDNCMIS